MKLSKAITLAAIISIAGIGSTAMAQGPRQEMPERPGVRAGFRIQEREDNGWQLGRPAVTGKVTDISGSNLSVLQASTTFAVDASSAIVHKAGATSTVDKITVGDVVSVYGTISGTSIKATAIRDGMLNGEGRGEMGRYMPGAQILAGNGQPVVGGSITSISGNSITVTTKTNIAYSVDASNAKIMKGNATSTISDLASGDEVIVQGAVNGTSITASTVLDHGVNPQIQAQNQNRPAGGFGGFFRAIGGFFGRMFGF